MVELSRGERGLLTDSQVARYADYFGVYQFEGTIYIRMESMPTNGNGVDAKGETIEIWEIYVCNSEGQEFILTFDFSEWAKENPAIEEPADYPWQNTEYASIRPRD